MANFPQNTFSAQIISVSRVVEQVCIYDNNLYQQFNCSDIIQRIVVDVFIFSRLDVIEIYRGYYYKSNIRKFKLSCERQ